MALVKCAECGNLVSNKTFSCLYYGYFPKGNCLNCEYFEQEFSETYGTCTISKDDFFRKDKSMCPAVKKRFNF